MKTHKIKKHKIAALFFMLFFTFFALSSPASSNTISIIIDGAPLSSEVAPILEANRVLIPFRTCAEALHATVNYNSEAQSIVMQKDNTIITLYIGSTLAYTKDQVINLEVPVKVINNRTLVPLRFIGEALNATVTWQQKNNAVIINTGAPQQPPAPSTPEVPESPEAPTLNKQELINSLLNRCNYIRGQKQMEELTLSKELSLMASNHSEDMMLNNFFATISPTRGDVVKRAKVFNMPTPAENIAKIDLTKDGSVTAAVDGWLKNDVTRLNLLHPSARYVGIGIHSLQSQPNILYITADFMLSPSYFTAPLFQTISQNKVQITGKSLLPKTKITVYRLSSTNQNLYAEKNSIEIATDATGSFQHSLTLWVPGTYTVQTGNSTIQIQYK